MKLFLVRHGETVWNAERRSQGHADIELSERGRLQAACLAQRLASEGLEAIYSSPLSRAVSTAAAIAAAHSLAVFTDDGLREMDQGDLEGLTGEQMRERHADVLRAWATTPATVRIPGGETLLELQERAWAAIERIRAAHHDATVAAVCHNFTILTIVCRALGLDLNHFRRLRHNLAALSVIEFSDRFPVLVAFNETRHLDGIDDTAAGGARR